VAEEIAKLCALPDDPAARAAQTLRVALALESWVSDAGKDVILSLYGVPVGEEP
jgi:hypothetical protein